MKCLPAILLLSICSCVQSVQKSDSNFNPYSYGHNYYECGTHALLEMRYQAACEALEEGVSRGDALSMVALGEAYENGTFGVVDYTKALNLYRRSSEMGNLIGMRNYGLCLLSGLGGIHDSTLADEMLQQSCKKAFSNIESNRDLVPSHILLGYAYSGGYGGLVIDDLAAIEHFSTALTINKNCDNWNAICLEAARALIDILYEQEELFSKQTHINAVNALREWIASHAFGNADAYSLQAAAINLNGNQSVYCSLFPDIIATLSWQAYSGDITAMYNLGCLAINVSGNLLCKEGGCKLIIKASSLGLLDAKIEVAELIRKGCLPACDYPAPDTIMKEVAELGHPSALLYLACWSMLDEGGTKSNSEADKLLKHAALRGEMDARRILHNGANVKDFYMYMARAGIGLHK